MEYVLSVVKNFVTRSKQLHAHNERSKSRSPGQNIDKLITLGLNLGHQVKSLKVYNLGPKSRSPGEIIEKFIILGLNLDHQVKSLTN